MKNKIRQSWQDIVFDVIVHVLLIGFAVLCVMPVWHLLMAAFSNTSDIAMAEGLILWPKKVDFGALKLVFQHKNLLSGFKNTLLYLAGALPLNILLTVMAGYFLACKGMKFKPLFAGLITFTMFFSGGMIPKYLNMRDLDLIGSLWAVIFVNTISVYNTMICKASIEAVPDSLVDSAYIDGANDFQIIFKVILPLIKATIAVLLLYYGVSHWNAWFSASIYLKDVDKLPLQNILRTILIANSSGGDMASDEFNAYAETIKYAMIVVSTAPIMCVYPFLQKYFAKGALIGAVKG
ncbi:MAG: carbohydrate ABC transporter permease [Lachnospiraceae bacterium]|nr:carbohydrate ABC transporter permease [Lachnospiraceae bacterium]